MADRVGSDGSPAAPIVLIADAPSHYDHVYGRLFVGPSYQDKLLPWWREAGLAREQFFLTSVLDYQPKQIDRVSEVEMRTAIDALHARLAALPGDGPVVIVPLGNYGLYATTSKGCVSFHYRDGKWKRPGITEWRGSVLEYEDRRGRRIKVIPTVHPAATFRTPGYEWVCQRDWQRIAADAKFRELRLPQRTHSILPSASEAIEWIRWTRSEAAKRASGRLLDGRLACSLDVETPKKVEYETRQKESTAAGAKCETCGHTKKWHTPSPVEVPAPVCSKKAPKKAGGALCECACFVAPKGKPRRVIISEAPYLDCIGYSWDPAFSLTIPTAPWMWQHDPAGWARLRAELVAFHADPNIDFGGMNFGFDLWWSAMEGMPIANPAWCIMSMHRVERPASEWHGLAFQASLDTREPYWKDDAKDPDSVQRYVGSREAFYTYNGKDNCAQIELAYVRHAGLQAAGRYDYWREMEAPMLAALHELSRVGIRVDAMGRAAEHDRVMAEAREVATAINEASGLAYKLVGKKAVSTKRLSSFLYGTGEGELRLPVQYKKVMDKATHAKVKRPTVDVVAVKRLMERFPTIERLQIVGKKALYHRRLLKVAASLSETKVSPDGRVYGFFKQDTTLGRLSCGAPPAGIGDNLQNQDRKLRQFYLPDTGAEA